MLSPPKHRSLNGNIVFGALTLGILSLLQRTTVTACELCLLVPSLASTTTARLRQVAVQELHRRLYRRPHFEFGGATTTRLQGDRRRN
jgi:hypothetical protein